MEKNMTNRRNIPLGSVLAEIFALKGAKVAAELAAHKGRHDLAEKIQRGEFVAPKGKFGPERAQARAVALKLLAA